MEGSSSGVRNTSVNLLAPYHGKVGEWESWGPGIARAKGGLKESKKA
jgi:hypothetical protein